MNPKITVIVPVYNVEKYLHKCIDSIINQTYKELEIILVNDGSPDNSASICDEYARKDNRIKVIHQKNKGLSGARNSGLEIATGEYVAFVDSDDWVHEKMYETLITEVLIHQTNLANCVLIESYKKRKEIPSENQKSIILDKKELLYNYFNYGFYVPRNLYSKALIKDFRFDENISFVEDMFFAIDIFEKVDKTIFIDFPFYIYNTDNDSSLTRVKYNKNTFLSLRANTYIQKKVTSIFPNDPELHTVIRERIIGNCLYHLQNFYLEINTDLDPDSVMKRKAKQTFNDNFVFFKKPSAFRTIIRLLNTSQLSYFYHFYFFISKQQILKRTNN